MLRVYLDQNHWVGLRKARVGHREGGRFKDALLLLEEATARGWVSLPLSMQHFMEVQHRRDWNSRLRLAGTMVRLSKWHGIAPQRVLVAHEIDRALHACFARPLVPRRAQVFGVGANHVFGRSTASYELPSEAATLPLHDRRMLERLGSAVKEAMLLVGPHPDCSVPGYDPLPHRRVAERFATEQEHLRARRRPHGFDRGDRGRRATSVDTFAELWGIHLTGLECGGGGRGWQALSQVAWRVPGVVSE